MQRNQAIDAVKGFAILIVMLGHCIVLNGLHETDPYLYDAIGSVQMPLFMAVSGALAGMSYARSRRAYLSVIGKRAQSYLIPFFSWFVVVFAVTHLIDQTISLRLFWQELVQLLFEPDRGLWFLTTLFFVTLAVTVSQYAADFLGRKEGGGRPFFFLLLVLICYGLFFLQARSGFSLFGPYLAVQYMPFYVLFYLFFAYRGMFPLLADASGEARGRRRLTGWIVCAVCLIGFVWRVIACDLTAPPQGIWELALSMLTSLMGTYACFFGVYAIYEKVLSKTEEKNAKSRADEGKTAEAEEEKKKCAVRGRLLPWIGQYTLEIYVLHFRFARLLPIRDDVRLYSASGIGYLIAIFAVMSLCTAASIYILKKIRLLDMFLFGKIVKHI